MAVDEAVDQDELDLDEGGDAADEGSDDAGHSGSDDSQGSDEPYLVLDERTVYKDKAAAEKGGRDTKEYLARYQKFGKPEDLERALEENQRLKRALVGGELSDEQKDELADLVKDPKLRRDWKNSKPVMKRLLDDEYVTKKQAIKERDEQFEAAIQLEFDDLEATLQKADINIDQRTRKRLRAIALDAMSDKDDPFGNKLVNAFRAHDPKRFVRELVKDSYGEEALEGKKQPRDGKGRFQSPEEIAAAARLEKGGKKASQLPKAPPDGGGAAGGSGATEQLPDVRGGGRRKILAERIKGWAARA